MFKEYAVLLEENENLQRQFQVCFFKMSTICSCHGDVSSFLSNYVNSGKVLLQDMRFFSDATFGQLKCFRVDDFHVLDVFNTTEFLTFRHKRKILSCKTKPFLRR